MYRYYKLVSYSALYFMFLLLLKFVNKLIHFLLGYNLYFRVDERTNSGNFSLVLFGRKGLLGVGISGNGCGGSVMQTS
jgi:hypothetical protein